MALFMYNHFWALCINQELWLPNQVGAGWHQGWCSCADTDLCRLSLLRVPAFSEEIGTQVSNVFISHRDQSLRWGLVADLPCAPCMDQEGTGHPKSSFPSFLHSRLFPEVGRGGVETGEILLFLLDRAGGPKSDTDQGRILGVVLCRAKSWTWMVFLGPFRDVGVCKDLLKF